MNLPRPIFIMSSERSGSNLLRTLLSNHSQLAGPMAAQFLRSFSPLIPYYGSLTDVENARALFGDMLAVVNHEQYGWNLSLDFEMVMETHHPRTFLDFVNLLYVEEMKRWGKRRFVCKENDLFEYAFKLKEFYGQASFIYLHRDPRDCVASWVEVPLCLNTPFQAARRWRAEQERCDVLIRTFGLPCFQLSYEELIRETPHVMEELLIYLDEPVEEACFQVDVKKNSGVTWNAYWKNLGKPVQSSNEGKYKKLFGQNTIEMIETTTQPYFKTLGYRPETPCRWEKPPFFFLTEQVKTKYLNRRLQKAHAHTTRVIEDREELINGIARKRMAQWLSAREVKIS